MAALLAPRSAWRTDPERRLRRLRRWFARVTSRLERADRLRRARRAARRIAPPLTAVALIAGAGLAALVWTLPWPVGLTLRHVAAAHNCFRAHAVGLTPARRGEPDYRPDQDADQDGGSCEPVSQGRDIRWWVDQ